VAVGDKGICGVEFCVVLYLEDGSSVVVAFCCL